MQVIVYLRYYDGSDRSWYDSLDIPDKTKKYVMLAKLVSWKYKSNRRVMIATVEVFNSSIELTHYDFMSLVLPASAFDHATMVMVDSNNKYIFA